MLRSLCLGMVVAALSMPGPAGAAGPPVDVYLVAGQSNATGQGRLANLPSGFAPDFVQGEQSIEVIERGVFDSLGGYRSRQLLEGADESLLERAVLVAGRARGSILEK